MSAAGPVNPVNPGSLPSGWLATIEASCTAIEQVVVSGRLDVEVPWCPAVDVAEVLDGHRPAQPPALPPDGDPRSWFAAGWRPLLETLAGLDPAAETSTWCSYDSTAAFWWRRMAHETAIHAADVHDALGVPWSAPDDVAADGVDEALRLWLGTQLGPNVFGAGRVNRLVAGEQFWTVGMNERNVEVNHLPVPPDATVTGTPVALYRWVWGRAGDDAVAIDDDHDTVTTLRAALARAMQ